MLCVTPTPDGFLAVANPQPVQATDCTLVVLSPAEAASPFNLTIEQGHILGVSILGVWAVAYVFRVIGIFLMREGETHEKEA